MRRGDEISNTSLTALDLKSIDDEVASLADWIETNLPDIMLSRQQG